MQTYFDTTHTNKNEILESLDHNGYVIIKNALQVGSLKQLQIDLEPHFEMRPDSKAHFFGFKTKRIEALFSKSVVAQDMATHPLIYELVHHVLGANCDSIQINLTQGIRINPGEHAQILHPDSALYPISNKPFEFIMNAIWAYSDFTKDNGATQLVPGSHKWVEGREPKADEVVYAEMPAGSVLVYAASLLHGGGANISQQPRTGIAIGYCLGWLRQSENQYLSYPPAIAKTFPEELQHLIGYNVHRPNLGWVNGHDPKILLTEENYDNVGAEDFLTPQQKALMEDYRRNQDLALTSHNLQAA
ncbi:MAG: phytanoyl-CoA dioxygenase family protein [Alphaproteobacteria bacterium]|nr:phytanoyl-CoA dioxygenase family protein [Alphaproteobacteria bacterium]